MRSIIVAALVAATLASATAVEPCVQAYNSDKITCPFAAAICESPDRDSVKFHIASGKIPPWLQGTLFRNLPARYNFGEDQMHHWFDGMSQIAGVSLDSADSISIKMRIQNTTSFQTMESTKSFPFTGFATVPHPGQVNFSSTAPLPGAGNGKFVVNNDVNIVQIAGRFFSTTDANIYVEFDGATLETLTPEGYAFNDTLHGHSACAHGPVDTETHEYFNLLLDMMPVYSGGNAKVLFWSTSIKESDFTSRDGVRPPLQRRLVANITIADSIVPYSHSFGLTKRHIVWLQQPIVFDPIALMMGETILSALKTLPQPGLIMHVVNRETGAHSTHPVDVDPEGHRCFYHTANVFEDVDGSIVYDAAFFSNCDAYKDLEIQNLLTKNLNFGGGQLMRIRLYPNATNARFGKLSGQVGAMFPWYNKQFHMRPYRYVYTTTLFDETGSQGNIAKIDVVTNATIASFSKPGRVLTEALFIPRSFDAVAPDTEQDGAVVTVAFNIKTNHSEVIALNATDLTELFIAEFPFAVPMHLHGIFCKPGNKECLWN